MLYNKIVRIIEDAMGEKREAIIATRIHTMIGDGDQSLMVLVSSLDLGPGIPVEWKLILLRY